MNWAIALLAPVFFWLVQIPIILVGEVALYCLTLGRRKIDWDAHLHRSGGDQVFWQEVSFWTGFAVLVLIGLGLRALSS